MKDLFVPVRSHKKSTGGQVSKKNGHAANGKYEPVEYKKTAIRDQITEEAAPSGGKAGLMRSTSKTKVGGNHKRNH